MKHVTGSDIAYLGPGLEAGPLPAFIYFALSAEESLSLEPFSAPAQVIDDLGLRVFSFTLPAHGPGSDKHKAMDHWAKHPEELQQFVAETAEKIEQLHVEWIEGSLGLGGLSRGGLIATWLATKLPQARYVLGFAPVTTFHDISLTAMISDLTHLHGVRFYIGNRDMRVGTEHCFHFIAALAETVHATRNRHLAVELRITPSIGRDGHGTAPETFTEGALWMKHKLLEL